MKRRFYTNKQQGSVIVDAAICIPIFVIALVIMIMLVAECGSEMETYHAMTDFAQETVDAIAAAGSDSVGISRELESGLCVDNVMILSRHVKTEIPVPDVFGKRITASERLAFRPFLGESVQPGMLDSALVYIFPKRGECYHVLGCTDMKDGAIQTVLTDRIRRKYRACRICDPDRLTNGCLVYLYSSSSRVYHRKECASITKVYVSIPKNEAVAQGYRPCAHCGGGEWTISNTE